MSKQLRYRGDFVSRAGVVWRIDIMQDADQPFDSIGVLTFEAEETLLMEWEEKSKEEVLQGCMATLKVESPGDRTYEDLYTIEVGRIRMDVYRNNALYWCGTLDAEFYEEPYEKAAKYPVSLKFSDFGVLGRLKYDLAGMRTLKEIVTYCLQRAGLTADIDESLISTCISGSTPMSLKDLKVRSDNFYDEDGEASTLQEVLEGILQPLGLRMIQRCGKVYVYDLNGLYTKGQAKPMQWDGDSQTMGVDVVYNNAKITWSTYAQSGNLAIQECWTIETDPNLIALNNLNGGSYNGARYFSYHYSQDYWDWADGSDAGFTIWISRTGKNAELLNSNVNFFKIVPQYDGSDAEGIAIYFTACLYWKIGNHDNYTAQIQTARYGEGHLPGVYNAISTPLFRNNPIWLPPVSNASKLCVRVGLDLLIDPRFNPFEEGVNWMKWMEQKDWYNQWNSRGNYFYVPVVIKFTTESGQTYVWDNRNIVGQDVKNAQVSTLGQTYGQWVSYNGNDNAPNAWGYLAYYQPDDRAEKSGVLGWRKNRPAINPHTGKIISVLANCSDGQYIPYPNFGGEGGNLTVQVHAGGWMISDGNANVSSSQVMNPYELWQKINWALVKLPEIEVMNNVQFDAPINTDDVEYKATINESAKESLEIDTICGSSSKGVPTARGAYFNTTTGKQITSLTRAGRTTQIEELLIGTLYSQFADRRTKLEGEAKIAADGVVPYTEQNQEGKVFVLTADTQNAIEDTSQAVIVELRPDEYKKEGEK